MRQPIISVVIPVYNVETCLRRCLDSVLAQTFSDFEVICVDDKSTDDSYNVLREYEAKDNRFHVVKNECNGGESYTRNVGFRQTKGKYVYFLDSDDAILPFCLDRACYAAENAKADMVMFCAIEKENGKDDHFFKLESRFSNKVWTGKELFVELEATSYVPTPVWAKLWRRDFLVENGLLFYEGIMHEDMLYTFAALVRAQRVVYLHDFLYEYFRRSTSISKQSCTQRGIESFVAIIDEILKIKESEPFSEGLDDAIQRYLAFFYVEAERRMAVYGFDKLPRLSSFLDDRKNRLYAQLRYLAKEHFLYHPSEDQVKILKSYEHVLVYGAGLVGTQIVSELLKSDITNIDVVVSNSKENKKTICGVPIISIADIPYPKSKCIVIVGVWKRLAVEVKQLILAAGYEHIFEFK